MKRVISLICGAVMAFSSLALTACGGGGGGNSDKETVIYVEVKSGGTGVAWVEKAGERFSNLKGKYSYEDGKEGVRIEPIASESPSIRNAETSGTAIFDLMGYPTIENYAKAGKVLQIDDVLTEKSDTRNGTPISPLEKISEDQLSRYMYNGHYYGGPSCEYYPSISYDKNLFDKYHLYLVKPEVSEDESYEGVIVDFYSTILEDHYYFLPDNNDNNNAMKSCGPDGVYNTDDDGLPSSLYELIALCEYMKGKTIHPFNFTGGYKYYSNFLCSALYTALQGYQRAKANYEFTGEIEIVTGFEEDEYLFPGVSDIKKPTTKMVTLTEENGYYTTWGIEKYYAEAFMDLCIKYSWFGPSVTNNDDQKAAMSKFVFSDHNGAAKIAMHLDGTYWYNEATEEDNYFQDLEDSKYLIAGMSDVRDVRVMPLPVNLTETVVEGEGKPQTLLEMNSGMLVINANVASNPGLMQACKEFLQFLYTDAELSAYTAGTSILRSMDYELSSDDKDKISLFGTNLLKLINTTGNKVVYVSASNATFNANIASFTQSWTNAVFGVSSVAPSLYEALAIQKKDGYKTVEDIFKKQAMTKTAWEAMYQGSSAVTDVDGLVTLNK